MRGPTVPTSLSLVPEAASEQLADAGPSFTDLAARATALSLRVNSRLDNFSLQREISSLADLVAALAEKLGAANGQ